MPTPAEAAAVTEAADEEAAPDLAEQNQALRDDLERLKKDHQALQKQVDTLQPLRSRITGYFDFGMFKVQSDDGSGIRTAKSLNYATPYGLDTPIEMGGGVSDTWIFVGDPLSTTINSRGDPADTGESRALTFNPIDNKGELSFIANNFHVAFLGVATPRLSVTSLIDFIPRGRNVAEPGVAFGDFVDIKLAYGEYVRAFANIVKLTFYAGKIDPVLGIEYRSQESPDRLSVTPSLICRYTCGRPLGVKGRAQFFDESLTLMVALTNGSSIIENYPLASEIDQNLDKTASGRLSYTLPLGGGLEVGASGSFGAQDLQPASGVKHWHYGFDIRLNNFKGLEVAAEFVQGKLKGTTQPMDVFCTTADCITYKGGYGQIGYLVNNWLMPYGRADFRDALHRSGANFVYITDLARFTGGIRLELGTSVVVKAEYTKVKQLGDLPQFKSDVMTSSLVFKW